MTTLPVGSERRCAPVSADSASSLALPSAQNLPVGSERRCAPVPADSASSLALPSAGARGARTVWRVVGAVLLVATVLAACSSHRTAKDFCQSVQSGENPLDIFDRYDPSDAAAKEQLQAGLARLQELQKSAPGEVRDPIQTLIDTTNKLIATLDPQAHDRPEFKVDANQVNAASTKVVSYASSNCGVDLTATTVSTSSLPPPPASTSS